MNCEDFFQKLKVEVDDQKIPMHKLFTAGFVSSFPCVAARCWGPKQVFTCDSDLQQDEKRTFAFY
jgi:hypothetical protein